MAARRVTYKTEKKGTYFEVVFQTFLEVLIILSKALTAVVTVVVLS